MISYISLQEDFATLLESSGDKLIVVDFSTDWCGPCRTMGPTFDVRTRALYLGCAYCAAVLQISSITFERNYDTSTEHSIKLKFCAISS